MAARYNAKGDQNLTAALITALTVGSNATTAQRNYIKRFVLSATTPSDTAISWTVQRCSALGTSTAVTPGLHDPGDRAAQAAVGKNHTVEPTYTANAFIWEGVRISARATVLWVAGPDEAILHAATVGAGIGWAALHATVTDLVDVQASWEE